MAYRWMLQLLGLFTLLSSVGCCAMCDSRWCQRHNPQACCSPPVVASAPPPVAVAPAYAGPQVRQGCTCTCP
jgi:hypothetical protein